MKRKVFFVVIVLFILASFVYSMDEKKGMIYQTFKAFPGTPGDPFTLLYPLEVTGNGKLRVYVQVMKGNKNDVVKATLVDIRSFDKVEPNLWEKWIQFEDKYVPSVLFLRVKNAKFLYDNLKYNVKKFLGKKDKPPKWYHGSDIARSGNNGRIEHIIDDKELMETEGKYVVILENENDTQIEGTMLIDFPGEIFDVERSLWETIPNKADLLVKDISLARGNRIVVTVAKDQGWMPDALWKLTGDKAVKLQITVGGTVIEKDLPEFDPQRNLKYGEVNYTVPDITITEDTAVTAFIDATNKVVERNKANNKKTMTLSPQEKQGGARQK